MKAKLRGLISLSETTTEILNSNHESVISTSAAIPFLIAEQSTHQPILLVAHSSKRASDLVAEISEFIDGVMEFPAWETLPHERLSPNSDTVAKRIHTLLHLENAKVVVSTARALVQPIISSITTTPLLNLEIGKEFNFEALLRELTLRAYSRVDLVERRGDFAVRGGIIDVFPPLAQHPVRIEFFGDEIEDMKYFEISDQRTFAPVIGALTLIPCKEILITQEVQARAGELKSQYLELREMCSKIESGIYVDGIESLAAVLHPEMKTLIDFLPNNFSVVILESERIKSRVIDLITTNQEFLEAAWSNVALTSEKAEGRKLAPLREELQAGAFADLATLREVAEGKGISWCNFDLFGYEDDPEITQFKEIEPFKNNVERLISEIKAKLTAGYLVVISLAGHGLLERYRDILSDADIPAVLKENFSSLNPRLRAAMMPALLLLVCPQDEKERLIRWS
jgi:transcription-repair coupling factor (superfamily II helicase)